MWAFHGGKKASEVVIGGIEWLEIVFKLLVDVEL